MRFKFWKAFEILWSNPHGNNFKFNWLGEVIRKQFLLSPRFQNRGKKKVRSVINFVSSIDRVHFYKKKKPYLCTMGLLWAYYHGYTAFPYFPSLEQYSYRFMSVYRAQKDGLYHLPRYINLPHIGGKWRGLEKT